MHIRRHVAGLAVTTLVAGVATAVTAVAASPAGAAPGTCDLHNGVKHVIEIVFDNVHFFRDNPNVPSDLEQMPNLLNFLENNGTVFSNSHTPMIAHTADDSLSIYTGLYGDRHGQPLTNTYNTYNPDGTTDTATSFAYWTSPVADTHFGGPTAGHDTTPSMTYSATVPASGTPNKITPAPWVPFTRAGCSVGNFSTANMVLENTNPDIPTVFGANSPEAQQTAADPDSHKNIETAQYIGEAIHCAQGDAICADSSRPVADNLPTEPGGYNGYQAVFGAKYVAPQLVAADGPQVADANGNLVDLNGNTLVEPFSGTPGFPGFNPTAAQSLAVLADMQEAGIPVTYGYISDTHDMKPGYGPCTSPGKALGPGDACSVAALHDYDTAFGQWLQRLSDDGITPANTEFMISAEENDQFAGANSVGRSTAPTPANCDGVTVACNYTSSQDGELQANIKGLLSTTASSGAQYDVQPQGASIYVHGQPAADDPTVRQLERDTAAMTNMTSNPYVNYSGVPNEKIVKYQAGALEQRVLHMQTNDPLRTPTYSLFPMPDYFFSTSGPNVSFNNGFAYDHGYYSPNIDITWAALVGPGVVNHGVDGPDATGGNESQDPNSTHTVPEASTQGTWVEEADLRPTLMYLTGLSDDYQSDGEVISQALTSPGAALAGTAELAAAYQQINSSVGAFATDTLIADSNALASGSMSDDSRYANEQLTLLDLANHRDMVAADIKATLARAALGISPGHGELRSELAQARALLRQAATLRAHA